MEVEGVDGGSISFLCFVIRFIEQKNYHLRYVSQF